MTEPEPHPNDPRAELSFIKKVIEDSRRAIAFDATPFLVWGGIVVAGTLLEYLLPSFGLRFAPVWLWLALIGLGWGYSLFAALRRRARARVKTLADRALGALWFGCWMAMTLVGFVGHFTGNVTGPAIPASLAIILGAGYYATGVLVAHGSVRLLAVGWWLVGAGLFVWKSPFTLAAFAVTIVVFQIVPGLLLQRRWRSELKLS